MPAFGALAAAAFLLASRSYEADKAARAPEPVAVDAAPPAAAALSLIANAFTIRRDTMNGLMMQQPLLISSLLMHAERHHGEQEIVSRRVEGDMHRNTYRELAARSRRMANALAALRRQARATASPRWPGTATATWSCTTRSSGSGAVLHTLNPRLHPDQVVWIADHAEDQVLFFDLTFLPLIEAIAARVKTIKAFVAMTDRAHMPASEQDARTCCATRT